MSTLTLRALSDSEVEKYLEITLEFFEKVGVSVTHEEALGLQKKARA